MSRKEEHELALQRRHQQRKETLEKYGKLLRSYSPRKVLSYGKAIDKYPDLESFSIDVVVKAYELRELLFKEHRLQHNFEIANGRSDISLGGFKTYKFPDDLPDIDFKKECIKCGIRKNTISICPSCWNEVREKPHKLENN